MDHAIQEKGTNRELLLTSGLSDMENDGLSSLKYSILEVKLEKLFTNVTVNITSEEDLAFSKITTEKPTLPPSKKFPNTFG